MKHPKSMSTFEKVIEEKTIIKGQKRGGSALGKKEGSRQKWAVAAELFDFGARLKCGARVHRL